MILYQKDFKVYAMVSQEKKPTHFILDVDGVMTDGGFYYSNEGKAMKRFGPDDHDALLLLRKYMDVVFVTGDKRGLPITQKRIAEDMGFPLFLVSTHERVAWIKQNYSLETVVYMGDGIFDAMVFQHVMYSIAPANAFFKTKAFAQYVTEHSGGRSAAAEAAWHLMEKFFEAPDVLNLHLAPGTGSGMWGSTAL